MQALIIKCVLITVCVAAAQITMESLVYSRTDIISLYHTRVHSEIRTALRKHGIATTATHRGVRGSSHKKTINTIVGNRRKVDPKHTSVNLNNLCCLSSSTNNRESDKNESLCFGLLNCQSVRNKSDQIIDLIETNNLDLVMLTETWLKSGETDARIIKDLTPQNFELHHKPRKSKHRGGGVGLLCNEKLHFKKSDIVDPTSFELLSGLIPFGSSCIRIQTIYRVPPSAKNKIKKGDFINEFASLLEIITTLPGKLLIVGDFNIHFDDPYDPEKREFDELLHVFGLHQLVSSSTHISGHVLDFVITRIDDNIIQNVQVADMISDHCLILSSLTATKPTFNQKIRKVRSIKNINMSHFFHDLELAVTKIDTTDEPNSFANQIGHAMSCVLDSHAPIKTKKLSTKIMVPWFNDDVRKAIIKRRRFEKLWRKDKTEIKRQMLRTARNEVCWVIEQSKRKHYNDKIVNCNKDQKKLFGVLDDLMHRKEATKFPTGSLSELVDSFEKYFVMKIENIRIKIIASTNRMLSIEHNTPCQSRMSEFTPVTEEELLLIIKGSKNTTCDLDHFPTELLKKCVPVLLPSLMRLFNLSLSSGIVPSSFKHAIVKPLLKKPSLDPENLKNYRPISNLSFLSKILEKIVAKRLSDYMTKNCLHEKMQSAYKTAHSTESALIRIQNDILLNLDKKQGVILVLLDLSAAFDTIDHDLMLQRLEESLGVKGAVLKWFSSYLKNRTSEISIEYEKSNPAKCKYGVPQGSVLGPILFTIYTMPLAKIIASYNINYHFYADDTQLYLSFDPKNRASFSDSLSTVQECIKDIKVWMNNNMLKLNDDKTEVLFISSPYFQNFLQEGASVLVDQTSVSRSKTARNIGVIFDDEMLLKEHITTVCKIAFFHLRNIGSIRRYLTSDACATLVHSLVSSRIDYCNALLVNLPACSLAKLQRVLNTAARIVSLRPKSEAITPILISLHWLPIKFRINYKVILFVFRCLHNLAPSYLTELLQLYAPGRDLRSSDKAILDYCTPSTKYGERAFSVSAAVLWNNLPDEIRVLENIGCFKSKLKTHLFKAAYNQEL